MQIDRDWVLKKPLCRRIWKHFDLQIFLENCLFPGSSLCWLSPALGYPAVPNPILIMSISRKAFSNFSFLTWCSSSDSLEFSQWCIGFLSTSKDWIFWYFCFCQSLHSPLKYLSYCCSILCIMVNMVLEIKFKPCALASSLDHPSECWKKTG